MERADTPWVYFALTGLDGMAGYTRGDAPGCDSATLQAFIPVCLRLSHWLFLINP
jgi:hypothetical protein